MNSKNRKIMKAKAESTVHDVKQSICSRSCWFSSAKTLALILMFYSCSITLTFYNQRFIHAYQFPLSMTVVHLIVKFVLACTIRNIIEWHTGKVRVILSWKMYIKKIAPAGIASSLDIGLSNWSFEFITISLYTMTKSTVIVFILFFAIIFKLEKLKCSLVIVVLFIATGLFLFTYQSTQFNSKGFTLVLLASVLSGLRWTLSQTVLQKEELGLTNPLDVMYHIQPWMILALLPLSAYIEGLYLASTHHAFNYREYSVLFTTMGIVLAGAFIAFFLEFSEFLLVQHTSSLSLSIAGIVKEVCTLYLASVFNGDTMTFMNAVGLVTCLIGISIHCIIKAIVNYRRNSVQEKPLDGSVELLLAHDEDSDNEEVILFETRN